MNQGPLGSRQTRGGRRGVCRGVCSSGRHGVPHALCWAVWHALNCMMHEPVDHICIVCVGGAAAACDTNWRALEADARTAAQVAIIIPFTEPSEQLQMQAVLSCVGRTGRQLLLTRLHTAAALRTVCAKLGECEPRVGSVPGTLRVAAAARRLRVAWHPHTNAFAFEGQVEGRVS